MNTEQKKYYKDNIEIIKEYRKEHNNKPEIKENTKEYKKEYYNENKEQIKECNKEYRNKPEIKE